MRQTLRLALVQMTSAARHQPNIATLRAACAEARAAGAEMIAFPEVAGLMNRRIEEIRSEIRAPEADPFIAAAREEAARHGLWIHTGSTPVLKAGETRFFNHASLIDANGALVASYDKIHLFDYFPPDGRPIVESRRYAPGQAAVLAQTPWGPLGMSICYDLRFGHLYHAYAKAGATLLVIPSAFTRPTGKAHWHILLRARAIECGAFVIAAAQTGTHEDGRETYGHALVVAPSGEVLLDLAEAPGLGVVDLDLSAVTAARQALPTLENERTFAGPATYA